MKNFKFAVIAAFLLVSVLSFSFKSTAPALTKVTVCHVPPGNPGNCHEIEVSMAALQAHLDHGDAMICHNEEEYPQYVQIVVDRNLSTAIYVEFLQP
jgi:hypothetical protein